jgi:hypothetical protein
MAGCLSFPASCRSPTRPAKWSRSGRGYPDFGRATALPRWQAGKISPDVLIDQPGANRPGVLATGLGRKPRGFRGDEPGHNGPSSSPGRRSGVCLCAGARGLSPFQGPIAFRQGRHSARWLRPSSTTCTEALQSGPQGVQRRGDTGDLCQLRMRGDPNLHSVFYVRR